MHARYTVSEQIITKLSLDWKRKKVKTEDKSAVRFVTLCY